MLAAPPAVLDVGAGMVLAGMVELGGGASAVVAGVELGGAVSTGTVYWGGHGTVVWWPITPRVSWQYVPGGGAGVVELGGGASAVVAVVELGGGASAVVAGVELGGAVTQSGSAWGVPQFSHRGSGPALAGGIAAHRAAMTAPAARARRSHRQAHSPRQLHGLDIDATSL